MKKIVKSVCLEDDSSTSEPDQTENK